MQGVSMNNLPTIKNCLGVQGNLNWMPGYLAFPRPIINLPFIKQHGSVTACVFQSRYDQNAPIYIFQQNQVNRRYFYKYVVYFFNAEITVLAWCISENQQINPDELFSKRGFVVCVISNACRHIFLGGNFAQSALIISPPFTTTCRLLSHLLIYFGSLCYKYSGLGSDCSL